MTDDTRPTILLGAKVPERMAAEFRAHCAAIGKPVSQVVRELIDARLKEYEL